jgi:hypothetical protein
MILTDEQVAQAWQDCYGEPLPEQYGLVFGRTVRSRQLKAVAEWLQNHRVKPEGTEKIRYELFKISIKEWAELLKEAL